MFRVWICLLSVLILAACTPCQKGQTRCNGTSVEACDGGAWAPVQNCTQVLSDKFPEGFTCKETIDTEKQTPIHACAPMSVEPEKVQEPGKETEAPAPGDAKAPAAAADGGKK